MAAKIASNPLTCDLRDPCRPLSGRRFLGTPLGTRKNNNNGSGTIAGNPPGLLRASAHRKKAGGPTKEREGTTMRKKKSKQEQDDLVEAFDEYEDEELEEFERDELSGFRGLVLDLAYRPVNVVGWKRAMCLEFMEKADVLEYYDQTVSSPSGSFYIPAVLRVPHLLQVVKRRRVKHSLSRTNILYRDSFTCQYCGSRENLTIDHVVPTSRGGEWSWENLVTACARCNSKKGQKTPEQAKMKLLKTPKAPKDYDILAIPLTSSAARMLRVKNRVPEEWQQYLSRPSP